MSSKNFSHSFALAVLIEIISRTVTAPNESKREHVVDKSAPAKKSAVVAKNSASEAAVVANELA
tara:strand:- start:31669 stop:31860 length:192 start_codon:yes stop_codon:yes gene_type:complete